MDDTLLTYQNWGSSYALPYLVDRRTKKCSPYPSCLPAYTQNYTLPNIDSDKHYDILKEFMSGIQPSRRHDCVAFSFRLASYPPWFTIPCNYKWNELMFICEKQDNEFEGVLFPLTDICPVTWVYSGNSCFKLIPRLYNQGKTVISLSCQLANGTLANLSPGKLSNS